MKSRLKLLSLASSLYTLAGLTILTAPAHAFGLLEADTSSGVYQSIPVYGEATKNSITARVTRGINPEGTNGSQGAFSEFTGNDVVTVDFNQPAVRVGVNTYTFGSEDISYTFQNGFSTRSGTGVYSNRWAPAGAYGEVNQSNYLAVFQGNSVTVNLGQNLNYFGINWGALSSGNDFAFYNDDQLIASFVYEDINPIAPVRATQHNGEGNGYLHFYANDATGVFNKILISQSKGGGFESDNHSFRFGESGFNFETGETVPVPYELESALGLMLFGLIWLTHRCWLKRQHKKQFA
ncbi:PFE-CTERM domain-containing protein [Lyngbya confervoides]|uniref:Exosortase n=1 Tax=Lyngbya confervoides BDU141951 TaxID=1574623 RepID=A0ABD4SZ39_9CYAN|nr:PEP-CTERM sorting domain-containing protein [Lyngbya confervoides]MCM1981605.1 hypothetical protein [Lyngbya confervoides BDU141951]